MRHEQGQIFSRRTFLRRSLQAGGAAATILFLPDNRSTTLHTYSTSINTSSPLGSVRAAVLEAPRLPIPTEIPKDVVPSELLQKEYGISIINPVDGAPHTELFIRQQALEFFPLFRYLKNKQNDLQEGARLTIIPIEDAIVNTQFLTPFQKSVLPESVLQFLEYQDRSEVTKNLAVYSKIQSDKLKEMNEVKTSIETRKRNGEITPERYEYEIKYVEEVYQSFTINAPTLNDLINTGAYGSGGMFHIYPSVINNTQKQRPDKLYIIRVGVGNARRVKILEKNSKTGELRVPLGNPLFFNIGRRAPNPGDSYSISDDFIITDDTIYPVKTKDVERNATGHIMNHETAHFNEEDPNRPFSHPGPDYVSLAVYERAKQFIEQGSTEGNFWVVKNKNGIMVAQNDPMLELLAA